MDWITAKNLNEAFIARLHHSDAKIERLAELELFDGCSRRSLANAARLVDFVEFEPGTVLLREGTPAAQVVIVNKGTVEVLGPGSDRTAAGKGAAFGEIAALGHHPYPQTVISRGYVEVAVIGVRDFRSLLDSLPCLALQVLQRAVKQPQRVA